MSKSFMHSLPQTLISTPNPLEERYPAGALKWRSGDGHTYITFPHQPMYSTATMLAREYWQLDDPAVTPGPGHWERIVCE